jgi:hypothetical protein
MSIALGHLTTRLRSVNATNEPSIHWPSAIVGLLLAVLVVVSVSWLASPRPIQTRAPAVPTAPAVVATPIPAPTPAPAPTESPAQRLRVAFTGGHGANLRTSPGERAQRVKTLPEGSTLDVVGGPQTVDGLVWRNVRDAAGATGWIAAPFAAPVS